jgi:Skp family chaperone for outer membrane proteins
MDDYAEAVEEIDELATAYQNNIDEAYAKVEEMYQNYMIAKAGLTYEEQQAEERNIIENEQKITTYQQNVFGTDGVLTKKQEEMLKPFHEKVANTINFYASNKGYDLVIDIATTALPYYSPSIDITDEIIKLLK